MNQVCGTLWLDKQAKILLQTRIWYPFMSAEDFCSRTFFSPEGLWHKNKNRRQDNEYYSRAKETVTNSTTSPWIMRRLQSGYFPEHFSSASLPLVFFMRNSVMWSTWLIIPPLSTADPAYGAAWSSEGRAHAVSPVFGRRGRCRLSNLKKKKISLDVLISFPYVYIPVVQTEAQRLCLWNLPMF